ncbi:hypothetical protein L227DRAFT_561671 [Lentinus tigrinus ALCF2SS1-6]|uniref:Uncharacterized protein n=1 Tax=Lentinus tigrinus ALCF2SS1-6 TaxID=1328759 RepID=A0A5C2SJ30_9APHY|nr:hypothetical protein L227DRAFT_561671 [Lentinus tigrinus ALCF2SS1-6]
MCPVPLRHLPPLPEDPTPAPYSIQIMPPTPSPLHALDNTVPMSVRPELHVQITHTTLSRNEEHTIPQVIRIPDTNSAPSSGTTPMIMLPSPSIKFSLPNSHLNDRIAKRCEWLAVPDWRPNDPVKRDDRPAHSSIDFMEMKGAHSVDWFMFIAHSE